MIETPATTGDLELGRLASEWTPHPPAASSSGPTTDRGRDSRGAASLSNAASGPVRATSPAYVGRTETKPHDELCGSSNHRATIPGKQMSDRLRNSTFRRTSRDSALPTVALRLLGALILTFSVLVGCGKSKLTAGFKPELLPVKITVDSTGKVSFSWDQSIATPIGVFSLGVSTAVYEPESDNELTVLIRRNGVLQEAYRLQGESRLQAVVVGITNFTIQRNRVELDVSASTPIGSNGAHDSARAAAEADRARAEADRALAEADRARAEAAKARAEAERAQAEAKRAEDLPTNPARQKPSDSAPSPEAKILRNAALSDQDAQACAEQGTCRLLLNTIFARHGRTFVDPDLRSYFSRQSWYREDDSYSPSLLTPIDWANVERLKRADR